MINRKTCSKIGGLLLMVFLISILIKQKTDESVKKSSPTWESLSEVVRRVLLLSSSVKGNQHKMCVLVPFRERDSQLKKFVPYMHQYLKTKNIDHSIYVIHQEDKYRFNRALLMNAGFLETENECDYIAIHDVDLLPNNPNLPYGYPKTGMMHVSGPGLHPKHTYKSFLGGIVLVTRTTFRKVNGMATSYWGWGQEDDEFSYRLKFYNYTLTRPTNITTGKKTFLDIGTSSPRDQKEDAKRIEAHKFETNHHLTGLNTTEYTVLSKKDLSMGNITYCQIDVELECDKQKTPWCV